MKKLTIDEIFTKKVSFTWLAGIKTLVIVDIHNNYLKISSLKSQGSLLQIKKQLSSNSCDFLFSEIICYNGNLFIIENIITEIINKYNLENYYLIIGINEYRTINLKIPTEVDDIQTWIDENTTKIIPEGRSENEFLFDTKKYFEDEDYGYYFVVLTRKEIINKFNQALKNFKDKILLITALITSFISYSKHFRVPKLFLEINEEKIGYCLINEKNELQINSRYFNELELVDIELQLNILDELIKSLILANGKNNEERPLVFCTIKTDQLKQNGFDFHLVNIGDEYIEFQSAFFTANEIFKNFDALPNLNFYNDIDKNRNSLEKKIFNNFLLLTGSIIIFFLLGLFFTEIYLNKKILVSDERISEANSVLQMIDHYEKENNNLKTNLNSLVQLKSDNLSNSKLLKILSEIVTDKSWYTKLTCKAVDKNKILIGIEGIAENQAEISEIMKNLESRNFKEVRLLFSNSLDKKELMKKYELHNANCYNFKIGAFFNENSK